MKMYVLQIMSEREKKKRKNAENGQIRKKKPIRYLWIRNKIKMSGRK